METKGCDWDEDIEDAKREREDREITLRRFGTLDPNIIKRRIAAENARRERIERRIVGE